jgi:hypothetical protein
MLFIDRFDIGSLWLSFIGCICSWYGFIDVFIHWRYGGLDVLACDSNVISDLVGFQLKLFWLEPLLSLGFDACVLGFVHFHLCIFLFFHKWHIRGWEEFFLEMVLKWFLLQVSWWNTRALGIFMWLHVWIDDVNWFLMQCIQVGEFWDMLFYTIA